MYNSVQPSVSEYCDFYNGSKHLGNNVKGNERSQPNGDTYLLSTQSVPETFTCITLFNFTATLRAKCVLTFLCWRGGN